MRRAIRLSGPYSVRFWLVLLALVCVLPAVLVAILLVDRSYHQERANLERDTVATARALGQAVDAELVGIQTVLQMLASSPQLQSGNLPEFYEQAQTAMRLTRGNNVLLTTASGQQLLNTLRALGEPLPPRGSPGLLQTVLETGRPAISDLFIGSVTARRLSPSRSQYSWRAGRPTASLCPCGRNVSARSCSSRKSRPAG
jgi:hypothetical protein